MVQGNLLAAGVLPADSGSLLLVGDIVGSFGVAFLIGRYESGDGWFAVGDYKKVPNEVGGHDTALPEEVPEKMKNLLARYRKLNEKTLDDILDFHHEFESIHPFQDGNGRVGRLILFKECLKYDIIPFIIDEDLKWYYYRGIF